MQRAARRTARVCSRIRFMRALPIAVLFVGLAVSLSAQTPPAARAAREWRQQHERAIMDEFVALLAIPNVSSDKTNIQRNAEAIRQMLAQRGVEAQLLTL